MAKRQLPEDFKEFLKCLNSNRVRYLLIGGWAVGIHSNPRLTADIDFLIGIDEKNIGKLIPVSIIQSYCQVVGTKKNKLFLDINN